MSERDILFENIVQDMSEGIITVGFNGIITSVNPEAEKILERTKEELVGVQYAQAFFEYEENDDFNQMILDAVYSKSEMHRGIVTYYTGETLKQVQVTTSYLKDGASTIGVVAVLSDLTELVELRDSIKAMKKIESLNARLELRNKLLSETFGRFLSDDIVRQLLDTPEGLSMGGQKRELTVMISDLRGFTSMSSSMEPEKLVDMLNHYFEKMTIIIENHGGSIIEFLGDGILAVFGAPTPLKSHARECVAAAIEMEAVMDEVNAWNREQDYPDLEMGIGITSGEVIVGNIGSVKRTKYGVIGLQVNLAGRIESYTVGGQVLVSEYTYDLLKDELITGGSFEITPKGVEGSLVVYNVTGMQGRYRLCIKDNEMEVRRLDRSREIIFHTIENKHTGEEDNIATLIGVSETTALISSATELEVFDNLVLDIGEQLFAKVTAVDGDEITLTFTMKPPGFERWYGELMG